MNIPLLRDTETQREPDGGSVGERMVRVLRFDRSGGSTTEERDGPFLVVDLRGIYDRVVGRRGETGRMGDVVSDLVEEERSDAETGERRGWFSRLFVVGAILGVVYALRRRTAGRPADEVAEETAAETEDLAQRAASVIQRRGEIAADRIERGSESVAQRIEASGEEAAERITEAGEQMEEAGEEMDETETVTVETGTEEADDTDESEEE